MTREQLERAIPVLESMLDRLDSISESLARIAYQVERDAVERAGDEETAVVWGREEYEPKQTDGTNDAVT